MTDWSFGRVEDPAEIVIERAAPIDFEIVTYPVVRHEHDDECPAECDLPALTAGGEELAEKFTARGDSPEGSTMRMLAATDVRGNADVRTVAKWIQACLVPEDRDRFWEMMDDPDIYVHAEAIKDLAIRLIETYTDRPTQSRSERRAGARRNGKTSGAGRAARASA